MKKITAILFTLLLLFTNASIVHADEQHIIVDDTIRNTFQAGDEEFLNQELQNIQDEYDINIYFIYDDSLSNDEISDYAKQFLDDHNISTDNVLLCLNSEYYVIKAIGPEADLVLNNKENIFKTYLDTVTAENYYEAIIDYYQSVVKLINGETYVSPAPVVKGLPRVYDDASLLSENENAKLTEKLESLSNKYNADFVVATTNSLNGADIQEYADDFYDYNDYSANGVLLLIDMDSREMTISTAGTLINILDDYTIDNIFDSMMDYMSSGNFFKAFNQFADSTDYYIERNTQPTSTDYPAYTPTTVKKTFGSTNLMIAGGVAALVTLIVFGALKGQLKSVAAKRTAGSYVVDRSFRITGYSDMFITSNVTRSPRPKPSDRSGGGSSFSGTSHSSHTSSSGSSHGGHSRGF